MWAQRPFFNKTSKKNLTLTKLIIFSVHAHFFYWNGKHWLESTPSHELSTQQKYGHFQLWHFFKHYNHLQIALVMNLWVDIHVGLIFIFNRFQMNALGRSNVGKKSSIVCNWISWEVRGLRDCKWRVRINWNFKNSNGTTLFMAYVKGLN